MKLDSTRLRFFLYVLLWLLLLGPGSATAEQWRWTGVERIVAVGDVHGAFDELTNTLKKAGIIDANLSWSGGAAHLVSMGDLVDRSARSREVLDLIMRLQSEASAAGGAVHVLLGNHEAMRVTGEMEYVTDAEYAAFRQEEDPATRQSAYQRFLQRQSKPDGDAAQAAFLESYPPGFFGLQAAFSPTGRYGAWILERPVVIVINETLFVHGGLTDAMAEGDLEAVNSRYRSDLVGGRPEAVRAITTVCRRRPTLVPRYRLVQPEQRGKPDRSRAHALRRQARRVRPYADGRLAHHSTHG
jgi:hypothetical protein